MFVFNKCLLTEHKFNGGVHVDFPEIQSFDPFSVARTIDHKENNNGTSFQTFELVKQEIRNKANIDNLKPVEYATKHEIKERVKKGKDANDDKQDSKMKYNFTDQEKSAKPNKENLPKPVKHKETKKSVTKELYVNIPKNHEYPIGNVNSQTLKVTRHRSPVDPRRRQYEGLRKPDFQENMQLIPKGLF